MKRRSLSAFALGLFVFLSIMPVAFSLIYFSLNISQQMKSSAEDTADFYLSQAMKRTDLTINALRNSTYYMISNRTVRDIMQADVAPDAVTRRQIEDDLSRMLMYNSAWMQDCLTGVCIFKDDRRFLTMFRSSIYSASTQRIRAVYEQLKDKNSITSLEVFPEYPSYAYCISDYIDLDTMEPLGKILFEIDPQQLMQSEFLTSLYPSASILLVNGDGKVLYTSFENTQQQSFAVGDTVSDLSSRSSKQFLVQNFCPSGNISAYVLIPYDEILAPIRDILYFYSGYVILALLITLIAGLSFYHLLTRPLRRMIGSMNQMAAGDLSVRMEDSSYQETESIIHAFNGMADRLEELFQEVYDKGRLLRDAEFKLLESQISPHFIFNVLETINMRCMVAGQPEISHMVTNLAQLLRSNILYKNQQKVTYAQELRYVKYYLELQKERFGDQLIYEVSYEEDILQYYLPKLTIQPLVENSVTHGLENKRGGGSVRVWIWEESDAIHVQVVDDGIGFDTAAVPLSDTGTDSHNNIALSNIHRRIRLLYGKEYGLQIHSTPGKGTEALLTLPHDTSNV